MKIYRDGILLCSKTDVLGIDDTVGKDLKIGSGDGNSYFCGELDDIRIYKRIITESEIQTLYKE